MSYIKALFVVASICSGAVAAVTGNNNRTDDVANPDIVFIVPDRSTPYANGLHNGIVTSAFNYEDKYLAEVREYGNYVQSKSLALLQEAIDTAKSSQPQIYAIWPMDMESKLLVAELHEAHGVPIVQINQLPESWELDHLLGYAGPKDAERAGNAGVMLVDAMKERGVTQSKVVVLGYPAAYGGYKLSIEAFRTAIAENEDDSVSIDIVKEAPLERENIQQRAFNVIVNLIDSGVEFNGVYSMDDNILLGAYDALNGKGRLYVKGENDGADAVTLVGTVCNGARELLENGKQYGTTIQAPFLEAALAFDQVIQYLEYGKLNETIRFIPNPIATGETWDTMVVEFLGKPYATDSLCTWSQLHERTNGLVNVNDAQDACDWVECIFVPMGLFIAGYVMVAINYILIVGCSIMLYIHRKKKVILLAQPFFLALILVGAAVDTTSIIFMSRDSRDYTKAELDAGCWAFPWLLTLGQMLTTATLVAKLARVKKVTSNMQPGSNFMQKVRVKTKDVLGFIIGGLAVDFIILGIWYGTDPFHWTTTVVSRDFQGLILQAVGQCSSNGNHAWVYPMVIVTLHFFFLVYANVLAFQTRKFHQVSDSKMAAVSVFNSIQLLILATVMVAMSGNNVSISYIIKASYAFLNNFGVIALMLLPKLYLCYKNQGDVRLTMNPARSSEGFISGLGDVSHINRATLTGRAQMISGSVARMVSDDDKFDDNEKGDDENADDETAHKES